MRSPLVPAILLLTALAAGLTRTPLPGQEPQRQAARDPDLPWPAQRGWGEVRELIDLHCADCHDDQSAKADLDLFAREQAAPVTWLDTVAAVRERVRTGEMPPADAAEPLDDKARRRLLAFCTATLRQQVPRLPVDPGAVTIRRLSRAEWEYTVLDLFGVRTAGAAAFPPDDLGYGFDNIGDALSFSTLHLEKHLAAAEAVAAEVFHGEDPGAPPVRQFQAEGMRTERGPDPGQRHGLAILYANCQLVATVRLPREGVYRLRVRAGAMQAGVGPAELRVAVDDAELQRFPIPHRDQRIVECNARLPGGERRIQLAFTNDFYDPDNPEPERRDRNLELDWLEVTGPLDARLLPEQQQWLVAADAPERPAADRLDAVLAALLPRLWRREVTGPELARLRALGASVLEAGEPFHRAAQRCLVAALCSPNFLFRIERAGPASAGEASAPLPGPELAVRLSYLLWSSAPDDELRRLSGGGALADAAQREAQVRRMLDDPRADRMASNFAAQWLELRALGECTPDPDRYPGFDDALRTALRRETELLFLTVLREELDVRTLLDCDFTFFDRRLAAFYGIDAAGLVDGEFRRVTLPSALRERGGLLGHASVHAITSNPTRTSPVKRGKWILENLLGQAPPPPPPGNDSFADESRARATPQGLREQLAEHRRDPVCASCHVRMDALGLALERYDAIGRRRDRRELGPIDASAALPDGRVIDGLGGLKQVLSQEPAFERTLAHKLFVYAVGRELRPIDRLRLDLAVERLREAGPVTIPDLILAVVESDAFTSRAAAPR